MPQKTVVVRSKFVLICGQLLTRKTEISVCGIGVLSAGFVCEGSIKANFHRYRHYLKSRFGNIVYKAMIWFADLGTHLTSGGMPLKGIAQSDKAGCQTTCFSHRIGRNIYQRIFVFKLHADISSGFTFKVSGACALREQVSQFCNICVLSRQTDAASGGFHPEGVTINSSWNDV